MKTILLLKLVISGFASPALLLFGVLGNGIDGGRFSNALFAPGHWATRTLHLKGAGHFHWHFVAEFVFDFVLIWIVLLIALTLIEKLLGKLISVGRVRA